MVTITLPNSGRIELYDLSLIHFVQSAGFRSNDIKSPSAAAELFAVVSARQPINIYRYVFSCVSMDALTVFYVC